jgi:hypothetical protein
VELLADPDGLAREACTLLAGYLPVLERLVAEPVSAPGGAAGMTPRAADAPEPWNGQAGRALMDAHEGTRRLEAALRYAVTGHPGMRRGGSTMNTHEALDAIPKLVAGLGRDAESATARILERWINEARCVPAIDEARQWRPLPSRACPYCGYCWLRGDMDARPPVISCFLVGCADGNGLRPVATMGTDEHGRPELAWADGRREIVDG